MAISDKSRKALWGRSGNRCGICKIELVLEKDPFNRRLNIGEECHIISQKAKGPRYEKLDDFDYDDYDNLLLLCRNHHKMIDEKIEAFPKDSLSKIKQEHEDWVKENLEVGDVAETTVKKTKRSSLIDYVTNKHDVEMNIKTSKQMLESYKGLEIAFSEVAKIKGIIAEIVNKLNEKAPEYHIQARDNRQHISDIRFKGHTLLVQFYQAYSNIAKDSYLLFGIINGLFDENGNADVFQPAEPISIIRLDIAYDEEGNFGWRDQEGNNEFYTSEEITDKWTNDFFKYVLK